MLDTKYSDIPSFRIAVIGPSASGKTAIINRLVNNNFHSLYEPTMDINNYTVLFNLNEYDVKTKTYVMLTLEDYFGLNNPLLQTQKELIKSDFLKMKQSQMVEAFQKLMFTSVEKRDQISKELEQKKAKNVTINKKDRNPKYALYEQIFENDKKIDRLGFIFVCDCTDSKGLDDLKTIIEKLHHIEKTNNLVYPKCVFINKIDKAADKKLLKTILTELEVFKVKYKIEVFRTSALTNQGVTEAFRKYISKIHQQQVDVKQNLGVDEAEQIDDDNMVSCTDKMDSCTKKMMCGNSMFSCGNAQPDEEEN